MLWSSISGSVHLLYTLCLNRVLFVRVFSCTMRLEANAQSVCVMTGCLSVGIYGFIDHRPEIENGSPRYECASMLP